MMERTWWEWMGGESEFAVERLGDLLREGRVRCVEVQQDRQTIAEFPVTAKATETQLAVVLARAVRAASVPGCVLRAELADLEGARVATLVTTAP
jgi:hypothetical protein